MAKLLRGKELYESLILEHLRIMEEQENKGYYDGESGLNIKNADEKELSRLRLKLRKYSNREERA